MRLAFVRLLPVFSVAAFSIAAFPAAALSATEPTAEERLTTLLDESWQFELREAPLFATSVGDHRYDDRLPRVRPADHRRRLAARREFLARLSAIDRDALSPAARTNHDIFGRLLRDEIADAELGHELLAITNRDGFHVEFAQLSDHWSLTTEADYRSYVARLAAFGQYADDHIELLREAIQRGWTQPAISLRGFEKTIEPHLVDDPAASLLYKPLRQFAASVPEGAREALAAAARQAIAESVVPGYRRFLKFLQDEYLPAARGSIGARALPGGADYYRHRVRHFTTLDIDPASVHRIGLDEVARINADMDGLLPKAGFAGTRAEFVARLRSDPKYYATTPDELLRRTALVLKRMDGELPRLFNRLPRTPYGIREIPAFIAPRTTTAYYSPPTGDGRIAGFYYVNTHDLKSRPLYEIEALSLHEAVPGHHLQLALQQELTDLPPLRRHGGFTVFVEGWGLYAEQLGYEAGFYTDPHSEFGRLSYEAWRACRLVVDTGIHDLGWDRAQAIEFMAEHTALARRNIEAEVDRYITWPGQALAYKIGELKIRQLRREAEERLGARFDVRAFHAAVLEQGSVPLDVLTRQVHEYLEHADGKN